MLLPQKRVSFSGMIPDNVSDLFIKPFSGREANVSLDNLFQHFPAFATTKYLGFSPLNLRLLFIFLLLWAKKQFLFSPSSLYS